MVHDEDATGKGETTGFGRTQRLTAVATTGLCIFGTFFVLHAAKSFLVPIIFAVFLKFTFQPFVDLLGRVGIPRAIGAVLVVLGAVAVLVFSVDKLSGPASEWFSRLPRAVREAERKLVPIKRQIRKLGRATGKVERLMTSTPTGRVVKLQDERLRSRVVDGMWSFLTGASVVLVLLYFLLVSGDHFTRRLESWLKTPATRAGARQMLKELQRSLSVYLITITLINLTLGAAVAGAMMLLEVPNPLLWGVMAAVLNYIPYLGALFGAATLGLVSLTTFNSTQGALLPPLAYLGLTAFEGSIITPRVLGRRFRMSAVAVFISLLLWGWLWGMAGMLLAVPLLTMVKIVSERIPALRVVSHFLSEE